MHEGQQDRPDRLEADSGLEAERDVSHRLRERIPHITERWHGDLLAHLNVRPQAVFPTDDLLDHMPLVVEHVVSLIEINSAIPDATLGALRDVAEFWRDAGYTVEESLLHFRILNRVLHEELRDLIEATALTLSGVQVARMAESLSHGSTLVQAVVVGSYRDHEEERFENFSSLLAHEIRGPLSAALVAFHGLAVLDPREPGTEVGEKRERAMERLERTLWQIRDVLDTVTTVVVPSSIARPEAERPLSDVVGTLVAEFRGGPHGVAVEDVGEIPDTEVPHRTVHLILHNMVRNAVAYSDPDKPERWVRLRCDHDPARGRWHLRVQDNGIGIPEREQEAIFRRFRRGSKARGEGFGLGLSIVRESARRMKGDVTVESEPGRGSTFTFSFPAR